MVTIGGYRIYWPVFLVLILLIAGIVVFIVLQSKKKNQKKTQMEIKTITAWQKKFLNQVFDEYEANTQAEEAEKQAISRLKGYMRHHYFWDADEVSELGDKTLQFLDYLLFLKIKEFVGTNNKNDAVLCLHLFDMVNGGPVFKGAVMDWLQDDLDEQKNDLRMDAYEARLLEIVASVITEIAGFVDEEIDKIPEDVEGIDEILKTYNKYDFATALQDSIKCNDFKSLAPETYDIAARGLVREIQKCIVSFSGDRFPQHRLYYIRCLACCLDKEPYDEVLDTIDLTAA